MGLNMIQLAALTEAAAPSPVHAQSGAAIARVRNPPGGWQYRQPRSVAAFFLHEGVTVGGLVMDVTEDFGDEILGAELPHAGAHNHIGKGEPKGRTTELFQAAIR
jgi:hypothetical protein